MQTKEEVKEAKEVQNNYLLNYSSGDDQPLGLLGTRTIKKKAKNVSKSPDGKSTDKKDESFSDVQTKEEVKEVQNNEDKLNAETELNKVD